MNKYHKTKYLYRKNHPWIDTYSRIKERCENSSRKDYGWKY